MKRTLNFDQFINENSYERPPYWAEMLLFHVYEIIPKLKDSKWRRGVGDWWYLSGKDEEVPSNWYDFPGGGIWMNTTVGGMTTYDSKGDPAEISPLNVSNWWKGKDGDKEVLWSKNPIELAYVIDPKTTYAWASKHPDKVGDLWKRMRGKHSGLLESAVSSRQEIADRFIQEIKDSDLGDPDSQVARIAGKFEDWWSLSGRDYDEGDVAYLESLERMERRVPEEQRYKGDVYMFEFMKYITQYSTIYRLASLDTRTMKLEINPDLKGIVQDTLEEIFDRILKEMKPGMHKGQKSGLL
jgi:hypothetical protein